jgi:purine-binding chemotaxis protein CheW
VTTTQARDAKEAEAETDGQDGKYLTFFIGQECYGLEICHVTEIIGMQKVTSVPDVPAYLKGVINLRGKVIPVMDVRLRFGLAARQYDDRTCIVVINVGPHTVGLVVDTVSEVLDIGASQIEMAGTLSSRQGKGYIQGLGKVGEDVKILLDAEKILSDVDFEGVQSA